MSFSMKCSISYIVMFLFLMLGACGSEVYIDGSKSNVELSTSSILKSKEAPSLTAPRVRVMPGMYYDTKLKCSCMYFIPLSIPPDPFAVPRCYPLADLQITSCLTTPDGSVTYDWGLTPDEDQFGQLSRLFSWVAVYEGEHCGRALWYPGGIGRAPAFRYFSFDATSTFTAKGYKSGYPSNPQACLAMGWPKDQTSIEHTELNESDFALESER